MEEEYVRSFSLIGFVLVILYLGATGVVNFGNIYHLAFLLVALGAWIWVSGRLIDEAM